MKSFELRMLVVAASLAATSAAVAHHSYASFDKNRTVSLQGTVVKWEWTNPHTFLTVKVAGANGAAQDWDIESASPSLLTRVGFARKSFNVGDKVTVRIHPHRERQFFGQLVGADLPGGGHLAVTLRDPNAQ